MILNEEWAEWAQSRITKQFQKDISAMLREQQEDILSPNSSFELSKQHFTRQGRILGYEDVIQTIENKKYIKE